tara:strand:- start:48 stop:1241 length:1194 start_codon:yes stop_codon:yes gene_type:complete
MTKELSDFFKIISEGKKKSVKEQTDNETLLSNEKVSVTVKATELKDFFTAINEEKKKLKEQRENDQKKLAQLESLLFAKDREPESEKSQNELEPIEQTWEDTESYEIEELDKQIKKEQDEPNLDQIKEAVQQANQVLLTEPSLVDQAANEITNPNIIKVEEKPETKEINPEDVIKELSKISKNTGVKLNEDISTLEGLKKEFTKFKELVSQQLSSIGGGGSTKISNMDDVDVSAQQNGFALKYNSSTGKYDFGEVASDLSAVDQDIIPDGNGTRSLGSSAKRFKDIFLSGQTINLGGATISSDGTGTVAVSATGVTLPEGSKAGSNKIAVAVTGSGGAEQAATVVPFFTKSGGLTTANTNFNFNSVVDDKFVYTGSKTFTLANGSALADSNITLFQF